MADKLNDVNDIVSMLDNMVAGGTGHINVTIDENAEAGKTVETMGCIDCAKGDLACSVPTLMEGMDDAFADENKQVRDFRFDPDDLSVMKYHFFH